MNKKKQELEQNELVDSLETWLETIKPHLSKIAMFTIVGVLGIIAIAFWFNTRKAITESQWREYFVSSRFPDARGMKTVAEMYPNTTVGNLALINSGDADAALGSRNIMLDKDDYGAKLRKAAEEYEKVLESSSVSEFAKMRATYALGYSYESLGRFEDAQEMYQAVIDSYPDTAESELAAKSLTRINDPALTAIHAAFREWVPDSTDVAPGAQGGFGTDSGLPPRPNISLPTAMEQAPDFNAAPEGVPGESNSGDPEDAEMSGDDGEDGDKEVEEKEDAEQGKADENNQKSESEKESGDEDDNTPSR